MTTQFPHSIKKGTEYELFHPNIIESFFSVIQNLINKALSAKKINEKSILGAFVYKNIEMLSGEKVNVWIEFNAKILPTGLVDAGIHSCIIFDEEMPDLILDKYNQLKEKINII